MHLLLTLLLAPAWGASLDQLEVAGPWGTPTTTDPSAVWWNPAGLAAGEGTRFMIEGAPIFGQVQYDKTDPYGYDGTDLVKSQAVLPFLGAATDAGVDGFGLGAALVVPTARGGAVADEIPWMHEYPQDGPVPPESSFGRYHLREARVAALYFMLGASYEIADRVSLGLGAALIDNSWQSRLDSEVLSSLDEQIEASTGSDSGYTNDMVQDPHYATTIAFDELKDQAFTFNAGVRAKILPDMLTAGVTYTHGARVDNTGSLTMNFNCPPEDDTLGRFGAQALGICYTTVNAAGSVGYRLPSRLQGSVLVQPVDGLDLTFMGGWVGWSVFTDYEIGISDIEARNPDADDPAALADALEQERLRARAAQDSGWGGLDVKYTLADGKVTLGGRALFDAAAIPDHAVSPNNFDANNLMLTGLVAARPVEQLQVGLSYTHHILETRVITDSGWAVNVEDGPQNEDRWFYPHSNGTYQGRIGRVGIQLRGFFDFDAAKRPPEDDELDAFDPEERDPDQDEVEGPTNPDDPDDPAKPRPPGSPGPPIPPPERG